MMDEREFPPLRNASREEAAGWPSLKQAMAEGKVRVGQMDEVEAVARAICAAYMHNDPDETLDDAMAKWGTDARDIARAAIAALDRFRGPSFMDVTLFDAGETHGREEGLREAAARFADLPGTMSGAAVAADILALIDAKERVSANE